VERSVTFLGFVPGERLAETFRSASAVVFPSRLSFALLEMQAMHAGVPIVVTDVRDQSYFVGDAGLVCPPDDPEAVGAQLARLLGDERLQADLAQRGRSRVREFSTERMVDGTLRAYADAGWVPEP
jgi:alpha-1,3-rhamnosyl/mannosyltransferase